MATSLGSSLVGSMYILDEPSIGLHPKDTERLIEVLKDLRDLGNTVIVVEHDEDIMKAADMIIDIGPEAGTHGGELVAQGTYDEILKADSLTAKYLNGKEEISGEIRYAFWDTTQQPYFEKCIEKFNEQYPDVKVTLEPSSWDEYWTKLEAGATGGSIADVFWMNGPNIMKYADGDVLMDISDRIKEDNIDTGKYPEALVELYNVDGKQYAIPKDFDTIGVWYNKKIFDEAGVPYPTDDWTWDDYITLNEKVAKSTRSVK